MTTRLWLKVYEQHWGPGYGFPDELWGKDVTFEHAPDVGESIYVLWNESGEQWLDLEVKNRYWTPDGHLEIEMQAIVHHPNAVCEEDADRRFKAMIQTGDRRYHLLEKLIRPEDDRDRPLDVALRASGWSTWRELEREGSSH